MHGRSFHLPSACPRSPRPRRKNIPHGEAKGTAIVAPGTTYTQNIADFVFAAFGRQNIKSFWLAGHSQGGATSHRIVCSDFFKDKVDGLLSLSGGRVGRAEINPRFGPPKADGSPPDPRLEERRITATLRAPPARHRSRCR